MPRPKELAPYQNLVFHALGGTNLTAGKPHNVGNMGWRSCFKQSDFDTKSKTWKTGAQPIRCDIPCFYFDKVVTQDYLDAGGDGPTWDWQTIGDGESRSGTKKDGFVFFDERFGRPRAAGEECGDVQVVREPVL